MPSQTSLTSTGATRQGRVAHFCEVHLCAAFDRGE